MQKTKIEWCDISWNPVKGLCPTGCWYCYARAMYKRFKWNPDLRLSRSTLENLSSIPKGTNKRIFVGSTIDLFHPRIPHTWITDILDEIEREDYHTFIFLTKNPARYAEFDFPDNCWLGVTVTGPQDAWRVEQLAINFGKSVGGALRGDKRPIKLNLPFVSIEPFLLPLENLGDHAFQFMDWVIIGALTGPKAKGRQPRKEWIQEIMAFYVKKFEEQGLNKPALFLKNNLKEVWGEDLIQEHPERRKP